MAAKGTEAKNIITQKILEIFPGSFISGKEIRIPIREGGETVQIKVALTCAKDIVGAEPAFSTPVQPTAEPTEDEKKDVANLLATLGF